MEKGAKMATCRYCGAQLSDEIEYCLKCGKSKSQRAVGKRPKQVTIVAILQIVSGVLGLLGIAVAISQLTGVWRPSEAQRLLYSDSVWWAWTIIGILLGAMVATAWIIVGVGLLQMRPRARSVALWLLAYSIVMAVITFFVTIKVFFIGPFPVGVLYASKEVQGERFLMFSGNMCSVLGSPIYAVILFIVLTRKTVVDAFQANRRDG
jgi:ribosomal protein L40E